jgi:hypothetical protein
MTNSIENPGNNPYVVTKADALAHDQNKKREETLSNEKHYFTEIVFSPSLKRGVEGRVGIDCAIKLLDYHGQDCVLFQLKNGAENGASAICVPGGEQDDDIYGNILFVLNKLYEGGKGAEVTRAIPPLAENVKEEIQKMIDSGVIKIKIITGNSSGISPFVAELQDRAEAHGLPNLKASVYNFSDKKDEKSFIYVSSDHLYFEQGDGSIYMEGENFPPLVAREIKAAQAVEQNSLENE